MNKDDIYYQKLVKKMTEVSVVSPQTVGPFTFIYKKMTPHLKIRPWKALSFTSIATAILLYLLLGTFLVRLTSILQFGF